MAKTPGAPLGLAIAGLGMAGAVMVRAAAAHPGVTLVAAADPHAAPRNAFARDFNARAYADMTELCTTSSTSRRRINSTPRTPRTPPAPASTLSSKSRWR
jgi:hypothetical protein